MTWQGETGAQSLVESIDYPFRIDMSVPQSSSDCTPHDLQGSRDWLLNSWGRPCGRRCSTDVVKDRHPYTYRTTEAIQERTCHPCSLRY